MKCKDCGAEEWDIILGYVREEEGRNLHLYQCMNCKRCVCGTDDVTDEGGEI